MRNLIKKKDNSNNTPIISPNNSSVNNSSVNNSSVNNLTQSVVSGIGLGVGSELAHQGIKKIFSDEQKEKPNETINHSSCDSIFTTYEKCLNNNEYNCKVFLEAFQECRKNNL